MTLAENALAFDLQDRPAEAIAAYEAAIAAGDRSAGTFLNLAVLYFLCADLGFVAGHRISSDLEQRSIGRMSELLGQLEGLSGVSYNELEEARFWEQYVRYLYLGGPPPIVSERGSLVPLFYLLSEAPTALVRQRAHELRNLVINRRTARERYIWSVIKDRV